MIKTIIVPTDGSDHATKAVELAADIAAKYGARLVLLHALLHHTTAAELKALLGGSAIPADLAAKLEDLQDAVLDMAANSIEGGIIFVPIPDDVLREVGDKILENARVTAEAKGVTEISAHRVDGNATQNIIAAAEHEGADMIVMGSRGLGNIAGLLMGSVSHKVSHLAICTCVTVK
ncbi:MAG: universal stress protein [Alphaproteobacteria bacterium]